MDKKIIKDKKQIKTEKDKIKEKMKTGSQNGWVNKTEE